MVNNGSIHYEHTEDGTMTQIGGCYAPVRNLDFPTRVAVSYINEDLTVSHKMNFKVAENKQFHNGFKNLRLLFSGICRQ